MIYGIGVAIDLLLGMNFIKKQDDEGAYSTPRKVWAGQQDSKIKRVGTFTRVQQP